MRASKVGRALATAGLRDHRPPHRLGGRYVFVHNSSPSRASQSPALPPRSVRTSHRPRPALRHWRAPDHRHGSRCPPARSCRRAGRTGSSALSSPSRTVSSAKSGSCRAAPGSSPIPLTSFASKTRPEVRGLPSPGVTRLQRCRVGGGALSCLRANLRPPLKLDVQFSRIQLSWMGLRSLKRRYQRDEADQLELLAPQPFRRIVLPACVPPSLRVVGPEPSHNPAIQLMEEFSDMRAAKVVSPSSDDRVDRLDQLAHS